MDKTNTKKNRKPAAHSKAGTIVGIILCVILLPILIVNVTMIVKGLIHPEKVPSFGGYSPLIVLTDSMWPKIKSGDLIIVKSVKPEELKARDVEYGDNGEVVKTNCEGDVISFFDPESGSSAVVTHRIVKIETDENGKRVFTTKGDANNTEDQPVPAENIVGIYQARISGAGKVAMFLQSTPGLIVCVALPMLLLIGYDLLRRRKYEKSKQKDTDALLAELEALRAKQSGDEPEGAPAEEAPKD